MDSLSTVPGRVSVMTLKSKGQIKDGGGNRRHALVDIITSADNTFILLEIYY